MHLDETAMNGIQLQLKFYHNIFLIYATNARVDSINTTSKQYKQEERFFARLISVAKIGNGVKSRWGKLQHAIVLSQLLQSYASKLQILSLYNVRITVPLYVYHSGLLRWYWDSRLP